MDALDDGKSSPGVIRRRGQNNLASRNSARFRKGKSLKPR